MRPKHRPCTARTAPRPGRRPVPGWVAAATARERGRCDDAAGTKRGDRSHRRDTGLHHLPAKVHVNEPPLTLSVHPLPQSFRSWPRRLFFQGVAGLPTAGITGGSHRLPRQPPTSLTDDTPNHGAWRLQKIRKYFPAIRVHGNKGIQVRGNMSLPHKIHEKRPAPIPQCGPQTANHQSVLNKIVRRNIAVLSAAVCAVEVRLWGGGGGRPEPPDVVPRYVLEPEVEPSVRPYAPPE